MLRVGNISDEVPLQKAHPIPPCVVLPIAMGLHNQKCPHGKYTNQQYILRVILAKNENVRIAAMRTTARLVV